MKGNDLGGALIAAVRDLNPALLQLIILVCWLLAFVCFIQGCLRVLQHSDDKVHAPSASGTVFSFVLAVILAALPQILSGAGETLFGSEKTATAASLGYGGRAVDYDRLLAAVFVIVNIVGLLAFIKGAFVFRGACDGEAGASAGRGCLHMIGGVCAWHIVALIGAVQATLGITVLRIS